MNAIFGILEPEVAAQPENDLSTAEPEALAEALDDPARRETAEDEIKYRLSKTPLANRFAYRFLLMWNRGRVRSLSPDEAADLARALDGLRCCCFKAIGVLLRAPGYRGDNRGFDPDTTRRFIEDRILEILSPYGNWQESELLVLALGRHFKNLPAGIRCDLIDAIRKEYTRKAKVLTFLSLNTPEDSPTSDCATDLDGAVELLSLRKDEFIDLLGELGYETLCVSAEFGQTDDDETGETRQARKGGLTRAISKKCGISLRQASERKRHLHEMMAEAGKAGHPLVSELCELLYVPTEERVDPRRLQVQDQEQEGSDDLEDSGPYVTATADAEDDRPEDEQ
jgi:hypothetical protein